MDITSDFILGYVRVLCFYVCYTYVAADELTLPIQSVMSARPEGRINETGRADQLPIGRVDTVFGRADRIPELLGIQRRSWS